jgi:hypothetical protein
MDTINWDRVNKNLRCPICREPAHIEPGTDGTWGEHTHRFPVSRTLAHELSKLSPEEISSKINELQTELDKYKSMIK